MSMKVNLDEVRTPVVEVTQGGQVLANLDPYQVARRVHSRLGVNLENLQSVSVGETLDGIKDAMDLPDISDSHAIALIRACVELLQQESEGKDG